MKSALARGWRVQRGSRKFQLRNRCRTHTGPTSAVPRLPSRRALEHLSRLLRHGREHWHSFGLTSTAQRFERGSVSRIRLRDRPAWCPVFRRCL